MYKPLLVGFHIHSLVYSYTGHVLNTVLCGALEAAALDDRVLDCVVELVAVVERLEAWAAVHAAVLEVHDRDERAHAHALVQVAEPAVLERLPRAIREPVRQVLVHRLHQLAQLDPDRLRQHLAST